jgi:hypothetical protein
MIRFLQASFIAFVIAFSLNLQAQQACTPDPQYTNTDTQRGVYPDSATGFAQGYAGTPYIQLVTIVVPQDTQVFPSPMPPTPFDSIVLASFTGLPNGFTYGCWNNSNVPNRCSWKGNSIGCLQINGNPTIADTGTYNLMFNGNAYVGGSTSPIAFSIDYYKIKINGPQSVSEPAKNMFTASQNEPNPFRGKTRINYTMPSAGDASLTVYNMLGKVVYSAKLQGNKGENFVEISSSALAPGVYMYMLSSASGNVTRRMVVEGK